MTESSKKVDEPSWFADLSLSTYQELCSVERQFKTDDHEYKLDFAFPCYRGENGKPYVLPVVKTAELVLAQDGSLTKEYLHAFGYESFNNAATQLLLGPHSPARVQNRAFAIQTLATTGAIRLGGEFLVQRLGMTTVYSTQQNVEFFDTTFLKAGFKHYKDLRYFNRYTLTLDIEGLLQDLAQADERSVVFLQVSGHNPTGYDPTLEQWNQIADIVAARKLFPFFNCPCQGFASGDIDVDMASIRMFEKRGFEFFCAQSFAWNFGLYNERVGALDIVVKDTSRVNPIKSHLLDTARHLYATPPSHGARVVAFILGDKMLCEQWKDNIAAIAERLKQMRSYFREELERYGAPGTWCHITNQVGTFCLTGLTEVQVEHLKKHYHIYMMTNGRLNVSGLNPDNVEYVAKAIYETLEVIPPIFITKTSS